MKRARFVKTLSIILALVFLTLLIPQFKVGAATSDSMGFDFDFSSTGDPIKDIFSQLTQWDYGWYWTHFADNQSDKYIEENYPYAKTVELLAATGGSAERDLFEDPLDRTVTNDYKFDSLIQACRNIVNQGLKPYIKTGNVPLKLSADPYISNSFSVNVRPPYDYDLYFDYIKAIADALVDEFGLDEVKTWTWGVLTEYENKDWFQVAGDTTGEATKVAYFKLYDYTVAALQASVGEENLVVGAHAMVCDEGLWDPRDLITHCASGTNYYTGRQGSQIDYLAFSLYDNRVGNLPNGKQLSLTQALDYLRDRAESVGLNDLKYGIDEGYILFGSDGRLFQLSHMTASTYQSGYTARHFKEAIESGLDWYSLWLYNTNGIWGAGDSAAEAVTTHIAELGSKMVGSDYVEAVTADTPINAGDQVDAFAGYNSAANTAYIMAYNFNPNDTATASEDISLKLDNIEAVYGDEVNVRQWYIDDDNGAWFPEWTTDSAGLTAEDYVFSRDNVQQPISMGTDRAKELWYENIEKYMELGTLKYTDTKETVNGNSLTLDASLMHHGVVFYEITNVKKKDEISGVTGTFALTGPADNATGLSVKPEFNWDTNAADSYTLVVSENSDLSSPVIDKSGILGASYRPEMALDGNTTYYWSVTAVNSDSGNAAAPTQSFTTRGKAPGYFALSSPAWDAVTSVTPTLTWEASPGAERYTLVLSPHDDLNDPVIVQDGLTGLSYTVPFQLDGSTQYYWTVIAENSSGATSTLTWKRPFKTEASEPTMVDSFDGGLNKTFAGSGFIGDGGAFWNENADAPTAWGSLNSLFRQNNEEEYIVYNFDGLKSFQATGLFASDTAPIADFIFYTSPDNSTWTQLPLTSGGYTDEPLNGGAWTKRIYSAGNLAAGTNYIKIEFGEMDSWRNRLDQVILSRLPVAEEPEPEPGEIIDGLNDWSKVYAKTDALTFIADMPEAWGDNNRVFWWEGADDQTTDQHIVYKLTGVKSLQAAGLFATNNTAEIQDFTFYTSPNNSKWTKLELTSGNYEDEPMNNGGWTRRNYTFGTLPEGANFVKIEFGGNTWVTQLGGAALRKVSLTEPDEIIDDLNDWSKVYAKTGALSFIADVPELWGDNCRAFWWEGAADQTPGQHIVYKLTGVRSLQAAGLFAHDTRPIADFSFYTSPDSSVWTLLPLTDGSYADEPLNGGNWTRRNYSFDNLPEGTRFVRIQFGGNTWAVQLGQVILKKAELPAATCMISVNAGTGGTAGGGGEFTQGAEATVTAAAATGYIFNGWYAGGTRVSTDEEYTFTVTESINMEARFTENNSGVNPPPAYPRPTSTPLPASEHERTIPGNGAVNIPVTVDDKTGEVTLKMGGEIMLSLAKDALAEVQDQGGDGVPTVTLDLSSVENAASAAIDAAAVQTFNETEVALKVKLPNAEITLPHEALAKLTEATGAAGLGNDAPITIEAALVDTSKLHGLQAAQVSRDETVISLDIFIGGVKIDVPIKVGMPYSLKPGEDRKAVCVWYMNDMGDLTNMAGTYDKDTGLITFTVPHQSYYVAGYDPVALWINDFRDIPGDASYYDAVAYVNYYALFAGDGNGNFMPAQSMTRSMLTAVLWSLDGKPAMNSAKSFSDVPADKWYHDAVIWAVKNGIASGVGGGKFAPEKSITRQEVAVMLFNYASSKGYVVPEYRLLPDFTDHNQIDAWAETAAGRLAEAGVINSDNNVFMPNKDVTRAEAAQIFKDFLRFVVGK